MKRHFEMMAAYNRWANGRIYAAVGELTEDELNRDLGAFFRSAMATLTHILVGDRIWQKRFAGEAAGLPDAVAFPVFDALQLAREAEDRRIVDWVGGLTEAELAGRFSYPTLPDMRTVSLRLAPALSNLFNHHTHHRGQVHMMLTVLGKPSLELDLIHFLRADEGSEFA